MRTPLPQFPIYADVLTKYKDNQMAGSNRSIFWLTGFDDISIPVRYKDANVIYGPVSQQSWAVSAGELMQQAFVSYRSCERLASALRAIISVKNE